MIEMEQFETDNGIGFRVTGYRPELFHMLQWLSSYGMGDCAQMPKITNPDPYLEHRATVIIDHDVDDQLPLEDFAAMFKLTYSRFKIDHPDATNTKSDFIAKLERLGQLAQAYADQGIQMDTELYKEIRIAAERMTDEEIQEAETPQQKDDNDNRENTNHSDPT